MAYSRNEFTFAGTREFDLSFAAGYAARSDVTAYLPSEGTALSFEWVTPARVRVTTPDIPLGAVIRFERTVSKEKLPFDLNQPAQASRDNINECVLHTFRAVQELLDGRFSESLNVDDIIQRSVREAVDTALQNFIFRTALEWEYQVSLHAEGDFDVIPISPGHILDLSAARWEVTEPPETRTELQVIRGGQLIMSYYILPDGTLEEPVPGVVTDTEAPLAIRSLTPGLILRGSIPAVWETYVDMVPDLTDYVQVFEDHKQ